MVSDHFLHVGVNWATPLLLTSLCAIWVTIMQRFFNEQLMKWGFGMANKKMEVDEDLPLFYNVTTLEQRRQMITMYNNMKNNFGFEYTDPDTIEALEKAEYPTNTITGTPWYNVMSNPKYTHDLNFVPSYVNERYKIIDDGYPEATTPEEIKYKCE